MSEATASPAHKPDRVYRKRIDRYADAIASLQKQDLRCANGRLIVFVSGIAIAWAAIAQGGAFFLWLLVPVLAFAGLVIIHERIRRAKARADTLLSFYERGMARLEDRWTGIGGDGAEFAPAEHLYAEDLDLFGAGSLYQLMCTARTRAGEETLAHWLCHAPHVDEIRARQEAVDELRQQIDLREELALLGGEVRAGVRPELLKRWAIAQAVLLPGPRYALAIALTTGAVLSVAGWAFDLWSAGPFVIFVLLEIAYARWARENVALATGSLSEPMKDLQVFAGVARLLEQTEFESPKLQTLRAKLMEGDKGASSRIKQLGTLFAWLEAAHNQMFAPVAIATLWTTHFAHALERWRLRHGRSVPAWLDTVGEFEALSSMACYAYEHPGDPFPEIIDDETRFDGKELGHPLLADKDCVRNSVLLGNTPKMLIVSGSNMSGKSTLLRVVGINAVLAYMGAPVRAKSLRLSPMVIGASLHIVDSIQGATSHFYAEIKRLRDIMDCHQNGAVVLFLLDEILHGTNSHDRRIGAEAVLKGLLKEGDIGLVTTHDLALTKMGEALGTDVANVHFVDHLEDGRLVFDYAMQQGVVQRSNALELMRSIGLEI